MKMSDKTLQKGFSTVEILLVVLLLVIIGGAGFTVLRKNKSTTTQSSNSTEAPVVAAPKTTIDASKVGTTDGITQLTTLDAQNESSVDAKYEATEKSDSTSTSKEVKNIGGAFDENSF